MIAFRELAYSHFLKSYRLPPPENKYLIQELPHMKKQIFYFLLAVVFIISIIGSCKHDIPKIPPDSITSVGDTTTACDPTKIYFQQQVWADD
jgi:hypothetical protein